MCANEHVLMNFDASNSKQIWKDCPDQSIYMKW